MRSSRSLSYTKVTNKAGAQVTMETTAGKHGGECKHVYMAVGEKVFAQGHRDRAGFIRGDLNTCETLLTGSVCVDHHYRL